MTFYNIRLIDNIPVPDRNECYKALRLAEIDGDMQRLGFEKVLSNFRYRKLDKDYRPPVGEAVEVKKAWYTKFFEWLKKVLKITSVSTTTDEIK